MWKTYSKTAVQEIRPYVPGESLTGISVNQEDIPEEGGMIARNSGNHGDQWYIGKKFFADNYAPLNVNQDILIDLQLNFLIKTR